MIEINNLTNFTVDKKFFTGVAKKVLKGENRLKKNVSIAFVSIKEIEKLNKKYKKKNRPTDVLSFESVLKDDFAEIIICPEVVKKDAKKAKTNFKLELAKMLIHGMLHVLGYRHEESESEAIKMEKAQEKYLLKV